MKDVQSSHDTRNIDIQKVGIKHLDLPLIIQRKNSSNQVVSAKAKVSVSLPRSYKGTHMSRFVEVLTKWHKKHLLGIDIKGCLDEIIHKLNATSGELEFKFKYFIDKEAPVSGNTSFMGYDCMFRGIIQDNDYKFILGVQVPVTTLCPCSKEISENGAHNQRTLISVKISYDESNQIWIEDLIKDIEECGSCEVYSLLKRSDEKHVTEQAWKNPKFVEDVLRDIVLKLRANNNITSFEVECESFESIHNHSAWAYQKEEK